MAAAHTGKVAGKEGKERHKSAILGLIAFILGTILGYLLGKTFWWGLLGGIIAVSVTIIVAEMIMTPELENKFENFMDED